MPEVVKEALPENTTDPEARIGSQSGKAQKKMKKVKVHLDTWDGFDD
jgi:hypothetical protein